MGTLFDHRFGELAETACHSHDVAFLSNPTVAECSFCGSESPSAYWQGAGVTVSCCRDCAVHVLPRLAADALTGEHGDMPYMPGQLRRQLTEITAEFWLGATLAISRCAQARSLQERMAKPRKVGAA